MKGERPPWLGARGSARQQRGAGGQDAAPPPGSPPVALRAVLGVGCAPPGPPPGATGAAVVTLHICPGGSHLWARRPSRRRCPHPSPRPAQVRSELRRGFHVWFGGGRGGWCQLPPIRRRAPARQRSFRPRDPGKGLDKGQLPHGPLRACPESCRPAPRGGAPLKCLPSSSIERAGDRVWKSSCKEGAGGGAAREDAGQPPRSRGGRVRACACPRASG